MRHQYIPKNCVECTQIVAPGTGGRGLCRRCYARFYRATHPALAERQREYLRTWREKHQEDVTAYNRAWYAAHREEQLADHAKRNREQPEIRRAYRLSHRAEAHAYYLTRRAAPKPQPTCRECSAPIGKNSRSGLCHTCRASLHWKMNRVTETQRHRRYMAEHRTERRAYSRRYRQAHAAACRAADRAFHKRNRKKRNAASRVRSRIYYATHKDQYIENAAKRRAMLRGQFVESVNWRSIWERDKGTCQMCRKRIPFEKMGRDHIWPISKGGTHEPRNAQTLCRPCNSKKSNTGPGQPYLL